MLARVLHATQKYLLKKQKKLVRGSNKTKEMSLIRNSLLKFMLSYFGGTIREICHIKATNESGIQPHDCQQAREDVGEIRVFFLFENVFLNLRTIFQPSRKTASEPRPSVTLH